MAIRLLIVDDHPVVRVGMRGIFGGDERFVIVGEAEDGQLAVKLAAELLPDVILLDLRMPVLDGVSAMQKILDAQPQARILILTTYDSDQDIRRALDAGALGYLLKDSPREELYRAVVLAAEGKPVLSMSISGRLFAGGDDALTEREIEVLAHAGKGETNAGIAKRLHISEATVKTHLAPLPPPPTPIRRCLKFSGCSRTSAPA
ncbi:MAG: response regulator transcription factor [Chloroflexi bacterium]|uniref:response regulator transcription factor n=1 Tax=Candidatus Flexifilum breve TaxID=3140694 RepID=UPI0031373676|nr:response regulator transcription factor [Chloroflexota bacterium]